MSGKIKSLKSRWQKADRIERVGIGMVVIAVVILLITFIVKKISYTHEAKERKKALADGPRVQVATVALSAPQRQLTLIGEARPYQSVTLYAKVSGFLTHVRADKGDVVSKGQLLAVVESPESNQDYEGAVSDARNKRAIADRIKPLLDQKLVSQQEADQAFSDADIAESKLRSLAAVKGYQEIRAPFDGMVTARFADPGALVQNAANSQTSALPLFTVSQVNRLRIYVYVDQRDAASIKRDVPVTIGLDERPDVHIKATVTRFSGELDARTRMLLAEVDLENKKGELVPGSFVKVSMDVQAQSYLQMPVEGLILKDAKTFAPVVTSSQTISFRPIVIANNDGERVTVLDGLQAGEKVALNLGNSIQDGSKVQPMEVPMAKTPQAGSGGKPGAPETAAPQAGSPQAQSSSRGTATATSSGTTASAPPAKKPESSAPTEGQISDHGKGDPSKEGQLPPSSNASATSEGGQGAKEIKAKPSKPQNQ